MKDLISPGDLVISRAGRDAGTVYFVTGLCGKLAVVADGKKHALERPKKKNVKHLEKLCASKEERDAAESAAEREFGADGKLRKTLSKIQVPDGKSRSSADSEAAVIGNRRD